MLWRSWDHHVTRHRLYEGNLIISLALASGLYLLTKQVYPWTENEWMNEWIIKWISEWMHSLMVSHPNSWFSPTFLSVAEWVVAFSWEAGPSVVKISRRLVLSHIWFSPSFCIPMVPYFLSHFNWDECHTAFSQ